MPTTPPRRGRPPAFNESDLFAATVAVIDRDGLDATTVKAIAAELGVTAMAVYRYCDTKEQLLDTIPDFLIRSIGADIAAAPDALETLRAMADSVGAVLDAHPQCAPLFHRPHVGPNMTAIAELTVGRLVAAGLQPERSVGLLRATMALVVGLRVTGGASAEASLGPVADDALGVWLTGVAAELSD